MDYNLSYILSRCYSSLPTNHYYLGRNMISFLLDSTVFSNLESQDLWRNLAAASSWIIRHNLPSPSKVILLQSVVYHLWKERNRRIFNTVESTAAALRLAIDSTMRDRFLSFPEPNLQSASLLQVYFSRLS